MVIIETSDLPQSVADAFEPAELQSIVDGLNAKALRAAPCLADDPRPEQLAEARLTLLGTIKRWAEAGAGALTQKSRTAGPFTDSESYDTRQRTGYNLWPSEVTDLQNICGSEGGAAFSVDTAAGSGVAHSAFCAVVFGARYCSCGADLTRGEYPLYEGGKFW